jgi:hypothetical protein
MKQSSTTRTRRRGNIDKKRFRSVLGAAWSEEIKGFALTAVAAATGFPSQMAERVLSCGENYRTATAIAVHSLIAVTS